VFSLEICTESFLESLDLSDAHVAFGESVLRPLRTCERFTAPLAHETVVTGEPSTAPAVRALRSVLHERQTEAVELHSGHTLLPNIARAFGSSSTTCVSIAFMTP
jgi:hypothetical protein